MQQNYIRVIFHGDLTIPTPKSGGVATLLAPKIDAYGCCCCSTCSSSTGQQKSSWRAYTVIGQYIVCVTDLFLKEDRHRHAIGTPTQSVV